MTCQQLQMHNKSNISLIFLDVVFICTSRSFPVCMDQTNISKVSSDPALTTSLLGSSARQANWTGRGEANVRKLRYLKYNTIHTKWCVYSVHIYEYNCMCVHACVVSYALKIILNACTLTHTHGTNIQAHDIIITLSSPVHVKCSHCSITRCTDYYLASVIECHRSNC